MGEPVGMKTKTGCIYTEIAIRKESNMNEVLEAGKVLKLADLLPYQEGRIVNMDLDIRFVSYVRYLFTIYSQFL